MRHLVLADDSLTIQKVVELTFIDQEIEVHCFSDGPSALSHLETGPVDVLLIDASLPVMDGYELCRRIKENPATAEVPVVLLVGMFDTLDEDMAGEAGFEAHLIKPFETSHLQEVVTRCLSRQSEPEEESSSVEEVGGEPAGPQAIAWSESDVRTEEAPQVGTEGAFERNSFPVPGGLENSRGDAPSWMFSLPVAVPSQRPVFHLSASQCASSPLQLEREIQLQPHSPRLSVDEGKSEAAFSTLQESGRESRDLSEAEMEQLIGMVLERLPSELRRLIPPLIQEIRSSQ